MSMLESHRGLPAIRWGLPVVALLVLALPANAQQNGAVDPALTTEAYLQPARAVADAVLAPRHENVRLSNLDPTGRWFLNTVSDGPPSLAVFARRHYNLGAFQVDPAANRSRRLTTRSNVGYELIPAEGGQRMRIEAPNGARVSGGTWSPDGTRLAYLAHFDDGSHIYVADADDGESRRITRDPVLATLVTGVDWTGDGRWVVTVLPPEDRGPEPPAAGVPTTPMVRLTTEGANRLRTYFDLLEDPHEMALAEYYATGQLARIEVDSRRVERIGPPAMIQRVDPSPDGRWFRVTTMRGPFSYIVPTSSAASVEELWGEDGQVAATLAERPLRDGGEPSDDDEEEDEEEERRGLSWRIDGPGLTYLQMEPEPDTAAADTTAADTAAADTAAAADTSGAARPAGQARRGARMDRVIHWAPPFDSTSVEVVYATRQRMNSFAFDESGRTLFLTRRSGSGDRATQRLTAVFLDEPEEDREEHEIYSHRTRDFREDPGSPMYTRAANGARAVRTSPDGGSVYLSGTRYFEDPSTDAPRPFVDRVDIRTGDAERLFESAPDAYERVAEVLDDDFSRLVITRETPTTVSDSWLVDRVAGTERRLTSNVDHTPEITAARREIVMITRPDGFRSRVRITLPAGYRDGTPLPAMFWFYPREYTEQEAYDERNLARFNKNSFNGVGARSMEILTLLGYAVVDPDLPVVGDNGRMNNNYVPDLRNTLATVIDTLEARGWIDRGRLGLGGHSYGAFGTANAMVHTPFFKAGIAGDGNYNRWLTPAGFQSERRYLWDAKQVYDEMSPFYHANRLTGALLMYHGMDDHNVGTHPDHSRRLFHALNVLGKTASLYMYPYEDHGPATRETLLDLWARWTAWLDTYVKNAGETGEPVISDADAGNGGR